MFCKLNSIQEVATAINAEVTNFPKFEANLNSCSHARQAVISSIKDSGLFLLGENHNYLCNSQVVYSLVKEFSFKKLALEWNPNLRALIDDLKGGEIRPETLKTVAMHEIGKDGRVTIAHLALVRQLLSEGFEPEDFIVFCGLIEENEEVTAQEKRSANTIIQNVELNKPMLVVAGSLHTQFESFVIPDGYHASDGNYYKFKGAGEVQNPVGKIIKSDARYTELKNCKIQYLDLQDLDTFFVENISQSAILLEGDAKAGLIIQTNNPAENHELRLGNYLKNIAQLRA